MENEIKVMYDGREYNVLGETPIEYRLYQLGWVDKIRCTPVNKSGIELITTERQRQIDVEGWTSEHDKEHDDEELAKAAACYAMPEYLRETTSIGVPFDWPFENKYWKPTPDDRIRELVKAGALLLAEIERLQNIQTSVRGNILVDQTPGDYTSTPNATNNFG